MADGGQSVVDASAIRTDFEIAGISPSFIPLFWKHVLQNPNCRWDEIPSLPSAAYPLLNSKFKSCTSTLHSYVDSSDQVTTKLLIKLQNGEFVEAVIMRYDTRLGKYNGKLRPVGPRSTLCFPHRKYGSNLLSGKIVEQLVHASRISAIRNVVFMGMGEPLNNYSAVVEAISVMTDTPFQLSPRKITVSTVGIIHGISKLQKEMPNLNLSVSLHEPVQDIRCQIMPAARAFLLDRLMNALREYHATVSKKYSSST